MTLRDVERRALPARLILRCLRKRLSEEDARARIASAARVLASGPEPRSDSDDPDDSDASSEGMRSPLRVADFFAPAPAPAPPARAAPSATSIASSAARIALRASTSRGALSSLSARVASLSASARARSANVARRLSRTRAASSTRRAAAAAAASSASRAFAASCSACLTRSRARSSLSCAESASRFRVSSDASSETSAPVTRSTTRPLRSPRATKAYRFMLYFSRRDRTADRSSSMWRVVDAVVCGAKRAEEVEKAEGPFAEGSFVSATIRASRDFFFAIAFGPTPTPTGPPPPRRRAASGGRPCARRGREPPGARVRSRRLCFLRTRRSRRPRLASPRQSSKTRGGASSDRVGVSEEAPLVKRQGRSAPTRPTWSTRSMRPRTSLAR